MAGYNSLPNYYRTMWAMQQFHQYDMETQLNWYPYERDVFVQMTVQHLEQEEQRLRQSQHG